MTNAIAELEIKEQCFFDEIDEFEKKFTHKVKCNQYETTGFCRHVERAEVEKFGKRRLLLMQERFGLVQRALGKILKKDG